jgi:hypothetical protein
MKIAAQATPEPTEEDIQFIQQMGIDHVVLWTGGEKAGYEYYASRRKIYEDHGIKVFGFGDTAVHTRTQLFSIYPTATQRSRNTKRIFAIWAKQAFHTPPMRTWRMASGLTLRSCSNLWHRLGTDSPARRVVRRRNPIGRINVANLGQESSCRWAPLPQWLQSLRRGHRIPGIERRERFVSADELLDCGL